MRLTLSAALAVYFCAPGAAMAQGNLVKAWIDQKAPDAVWGQFQGLEPATLFDTKVRTEDRYMPAYGWKISSFSAVSLAPGGERIAFKAQGGSSSALGIFKVDAGSAQILDTACDARALTWSPTGRYLAVQDSQGLLNNTLRVMAYDDLSSEMEISGDVLADLGYNTYKFRNEGIDGGKDIWRTEVFDAKWTSERALAFKVKRVHLIIGPKPPPEPAGDPADENWAFDVISKKFVKL